MHPPRPPMARAAPAQRWPRPIDSEVGERVLPRLPASGRALDQCSLGCGVDGRWRRPTESSANLDAPEARISAVIEDGAHFSNVLARRGGLRALDRAGIADDQPSRSMLFECRIRGAPT